jgi:hypothetical protein
LTKVFSLRIFQSNAWKEYITGINLHGIKKEKMELLSLFFFLEHAGELSIIILRRKGGGKSPLQQLPIHRTNHLLHKERTTKEPHTPGLRPLLLLRPEAWRAL